MVWKQHWYQQQENLQRYWQQKRQRGPIERGWGWLFSWLQNNPTKTTTGWTRRRQNNSTDTITTAENKIRPFSTTMSTSSSNKRIVKIPTKIRI